MAEETPTKPTPLWRRLLPFVVGIALVAFVFARIDYPAFLAALTRVNVPYFLAFAAAFLLSLLTADAFATTFVYRRTIPTVSYKDFWLLRGASYLPSIINHHVGQAFITVYLSRVHGVPLARTAGSTLLVYASWFGAILGLGCIAVYANGKSPLLIVGVVATGLVYLAIIAAKPEFLAKRGLLAPLFEAGVKGHLLALAVRIPHVIVLFFGTWLPFRFFGVDIPFTAAIAFIPIMMVVVTLPLTPQGFGTRDVLAATLFEVYAKGTHAERLASIAASTTSWGVAITICEAVLGLLLIRRVVKITARG